MSGNFLTPCSGWAALAAHEPVSPLGLADSPFPPPQPLPYPTPVLSPPAAARLLAHLLVREPLLACPLCFLRGSPFPAYALLTLAANVPASASSEACPVDLLASAPLALARGPPRPWYPTPSTSAMAARLAACVRLQSVRIGSVRILHPTVAICSPPEAQQVCPSCCPVSGRFRSGHFS